jgi:hypothetical protein
MGGTDGWQQLFASMADAWAAIGPRTARAGDASGWPVVYEAMQAQEERLRSDGRWVSGASDLLRVARVVDSELVHSNVVAWLLDPTSRHGLGDRVLSAILAAGWPDEPQPPTSRARVDREVPREHRIADVIVTVGRTTLVIENKVWSDESEAQCEDLYQLWSDGVSDVRFLLLTLDGHPPRQTKSRAAAEAWRSLSYRSLAALVAQVSKGQAATLASLAVLQYLASLDALVGRAEQFTISNEMGAFDDGAA